MAADWTNYLKGMQDSCNISKIETTISKKSAIPKNLHTSMTKYTVKNSMFGTKDVDIRLKNATAFGYPIHRITHNITSENMEFVVYFSNSNFTKIKSQFTIKVEGKSYAVGAKKSWLIYSESENIKPQKILNVPYKGMDADYFGNQSDWNNVLIIEDQGWLYYGTEYGQYPFLTFDSKKKTITCGKNFG